MTTRGERATDTVHRPPTATRDTSGPHCTAHTRHTIDGRTTRGPRSIRTLRRRSSAQPSGGICASAYGRITRRIGAPRRWRCLDSFAAPSRRTLAPSTAPRIRHGRRRCRCRTPSRASQRERPGSARDRPATATGRAASRHRARPSHAAAAPTGEKSPPRPMRAERRRSSAARRIQLFQACEWVKQAHAVGG